MPTPTPSELFEGENSSLRKTYNDAVAPTPKEPHDKEDCPCPYALEPKLLSRAYWVCPVCGRDVSLEYVILRGKDK